jgi:hypothetical protein
VERSGKAVNSRSDLAFKEEARDFAGWTVLDFKTVTSSVRMPSSNLSKTGVSR